MGESASLLLFHNLIYLMIILHLFAVVNRESEKYSEFCFFFICC